MHLIPPYVLKNRTKRYKLQLSITKRWLCEKRISIDFSVTLIIFVYFSLAFMVLQLKLVGKRGVYKDTQLAEEGGKIYEKDGIIYNCAFSVCDITAGLNQLHTQP